MSKRRIHQIIRARAARAASFRPRPAYALFPSGCWDVSGERNKVAA